jgi:GH15 family glucan-1,4-alpha-glucosidase
MQRQPALIRDYAIIGDCRSAALVSRFGSIDWLCWPRFDSSSYFASLLDPIRGGRWCIAPAHPFRTERRYLADSNVLETVFETQSGAIRVRDAMSIASEEEEAKLYLPEHEIVRLVECIGGEVEVETLFEPRPGYGLTRFHLQNRGKFGFWVDMGSRCLILRTDASLRAESDAISGRQKLRGGEALRFSLSFNSNAPAELRQMDQVQECLERSTSWWRQWAARANYQGPHRDAVMRSALVLKLLIYGPSGAIVAAPTTSLPERIGGQLNWDYRYCWLRDAAFTVRALFALGYGEEASAFVGWLLHATRLTRPELRILYDVYGNLPKPERVLPHLSGHAGSRPVRVGNAAQNQLQLDVYGEVIEAAVRFIRAGGSFDSDTAAMLRAWGNYVCKHWSDPDEGIWEPRSGRVPHTHSRVLCWVALEGLLEMQWKGHLHRNPSELFRQTRDAIRREIIEHSWNDRVQSYVQIPGTDEVDVSLLALALYGFEPASSTRMQSTFQRIRKTLGADSCLFFRNPELAGQGDGAFGIGSFWAAHYLAMGGGTLQQAKDAFEATLAFANEVGLFAEEMDPRTGEPLGNFPQAFTHIGLINAALSIQEREHGISLTQDRTPQAPQAAEIRT